MQDATTTETTPTQAAGTISPSVGRIVWYWPSQDEINAGRIAYESQSMQPLAAQVAFVHSDRMVNLSVVDHCGNQFRRTSVQLVQPGDEEPLSSQTAYASWMPYQIAVAQIEPTEEPVAVPFPVLDGEPTASEAAAEA